MTLPSLKALGIAKRESIREVFGICRKTVTAHLERKEKFLTIIGFYPGDSLVTATPSMTGGCA